MMHRGAGRREQLDEQAPEDQMSDDDNAAPEMPSEPEGEKEDPLLLALEDLMGRVVTAIDDVKRHPGGRSPGGPTVHEELATMLRPVLEVAAHTGPSIARTYYSSLGGPGEGVEASCEDVYERVVSDLVLPFMLEFAQSDTIPAKRAASLEFFHNFWKECQKAGSWLDMTSTGPTMGPYGSGGGSHSSSSDTPAIRVLQKRRAIKRMAREGEILRYWVQASIYCTLPGVFTSNVSEDAVASRGVIAASASLRPSLRHIAKRVDDADDRGAAKLYAPVMKMVEGVLKKLFANAADSGDGLRSACIKFLEIVAVSCSSKGEQSDGRRRKSQNTKDFSIDDLPEGHPVITREALESIAEYAFTTLRGLVTMGGQVKIDVNLLSDVMLSGDDGLPSSAVVNVLKPAALAYLALESSIHAEDDQLEFNINRTETEFEFPLSQKPYSLAINAVSMLAVNRPVFYKEAATCLARRAADPPTESATFSKPASIAIVSHLRASCLTLLRNALSVTTNGSEILHQALSKYDMSIQADKALAMAEQTAALKTAGRAARNRAAMFYEWDASEDKRVSKRSRETDDALAKIRAAKAARGLGHGIQLPSSMVDGVELILANLTHLPTTRPSGASKNRKRPVNFDYVVDAVMTNGVSLAEDEGRWYERDGGNCWYMDTENETQFNLDEKTLLAAEIEHDKTKAESLDKKAAEELPKIFQAQCQTAASQALSRILKTTAGSRDDGMVDFGYQVAAKLAWTLKNVKPSSDLKAAREFAAESVHRVVSKVEDKTSSGMLVVDKSELQNFVDEYPLVSACLVRDLTPKAGSNSHTSTRPSTVANPSLTLANSILNEAYMESCDSPKDATDLSYDKAFNLFAAAVVHSSDQANEKPNDAEKKRVATLGTSSITQQLGILPYISPVSLHYVSGLCDVENITKKAADAARKSSSQTIAASAAINAAKMAAEKRATAALVSLRDVAFQRSNPETRRAAIFCAVSIAAGHISASSSIEDKALKLVMNVFFPKSEVHSEMVVEAATSSLEQAAQFAIDNYDKIEEANKEAAKGASESEHGPVSSDAEKAAMENVKKPALLFMALCVRRPEMMKQLMEQSCRKKADVLSKAVRENMPKLARAVATKHGAAAIALQVADMVGIDEVPMLLAFLDNLAPIGERNLPSEELIEACHKIQESKLTAEGKQDPRFLIPVVTGMKRVDLVKKLPDFVMADNKIFMASLVHMGSRLARHALIFRDEPDPENPMLTGMTLCESFVFLHKMDFAALDIPQKRYLEVVRLCLEDDEVFTDTVVREALDYISGTFLAEEDATLPLAYMRTIILSTTKHESLQNWMCHILLPRLVEGKIYTLPRQWVGWMRCVSMMEKAGVDGVQDVIGKLPAEQLEVYRNKYPAGA